MSTLKTALLGSAAALALTVGVVQAETVGVTDTEIKIGNTNPYSGPASSYGVIGKSISACFDKLNAEGGINGRKLDFISLDDGYSPPKTKEQIRKLVEREKVAFLFQTLGTPTNSAVHQYVNKKKVPHLFVATGATKWGDPANFPWTMGWQPNYQTEGAIFGNWVLANKPNGKVGILYQNDDYGKDYVHGFKDALGDKAATMIVSEQSYEVTDPTVDSQVVNLAAAGADVFFDVAIPKFAAQAIRKKADIGWDAVHLLNSVAASVASTLRPAGIENSQGVISTVYLKDPTDPAWAKDEERTEWVAFMNDFYPDGDLDNPFNAYGWAVCHTIKDVLARAGNDLSRENIMAKAASIKDLRVPMLLPGILINTSGDDFYPIEGMQMQKFEGEEFKRFGPVVKADAPGS
jgi:branched-chain amino acid transport system substrate-binding protein